MRQAYRAHWGRIVGVWIVLAGVLWGLTQLWSCSPANASVMVETIAGEAAGESFEGQVAVAEVIRNRADLGGWWGNTPEEVCLKRWQFSFWNDRWLASRWLGRNKGALEVAGRAWEASDGSNLTGGATHYYNPRLASPSWASKLRNRVTIGNHVFGRV